MGTKGWEYGKLHTRGLVGIYRGQVNYRLGWGHIVINVLPFHFIGNMYCEIVEVVDILNST
jgi:hypothetical protein